MAQPIEEILNHFFGEHQASKVVLAGDAGAGKTWVARKVCDAALKKELSYGSIWIVPAENPEKKPLLDTIASQLSLLSCDEEWVDDEDSEEVKEKKDKEQEDLKTRILDKLEKMRTGKPKNQALNIDRGIQGETELGHEAAAGKLRYLVVVLDNITEEEEESIVTELKNILHSSFLKMLIIRKESTDGNAGAARESKGDAIQPDDTKAIRLEPLSSRDALILLRGRVKTEVSENQMLAIAEKALGLPAGMILVAEALNHICLEDGVQAFEFAMDDVAKMKGDDITAVLQFAYDMLPEETEIAQLPSLSDLVELRELLLKGCKKLTQLRGLSPLEKLEVLDLSGCCDLIIGPEESFSRMSRLKKLDLSGTKIESLPLDCFPSNLRHLSLRDCNILKQLPSLESLSKLERLNLCGAESLPKFKADFLHHMVKLQILNLSKTHLDELPSLSHLTDLTELSLSGCCCVPTGLEVLTELKVLDLSGTEVQSLPLENYSKLHKLVLSNCSELDTSMNFGSLSHLEVLDLSGTKMTHFPYEVEHLPYLRELHLLNVKQMQVDWSRSGIFSNLKKLRLDCCPKLVSLCDKSAKYEMPMMQTLELLDLPSLSRIGVEMPSLETLKVRACVKLEELEWNCFMNLKKLHLDCCPKLVYIFYPAKLPENLETLKVQLCNKLETVFKGDESGEYEMPQIQTLELLYLPALKRIGVEMPSLETLKVRACENLHDLELNRFPNLKTKEIDLVSPS
ncbi:hypothetical protein CRG98_025464 [Punica granatum]|uniref:Disease resistance protein At4g27190-like leucine-rich repeats domain-containing protein n=1 Tax=Punica granatum TaxID=22663 RepID=A0A2I0JD16_PUNGR|nr:hypothetical protein CRG98_025464 [Punica granatum]